MIIQLNCTRNNPLHTAIPINIFMILFTIMKSKRIIPAIALVLMPFAYHFLKDIYKIGVKDGKATHQAHDFVKLLWNGKDAAQALCMHGIEGRIKELAHFNCAELANVLFQQSEKAKLLAVKCVQLGKGCEFVIHRFVVKTNDVTQDLGDGDGCVGVKLS